MRERVSEQCDGDNLTLNAQNGKKKHGYYVDGSNTLTMLSNLCTVHCSLATQRHLMANVHRRH